MIVPHLVVRDAAEAVEFYVRAFSATVLYRSPSPTGAGEHIHIKVWNSLVQISSEEAGQKREWVEGALLASPETLSGSTCAFQVAVPDVDEAYRHAVKHGAAPALPPTNMFWGGPIRVGAGSVWARLGSLDHCGGADSG
jgi:PhnB protein